MRDVLTRLVSALEQGREVLHCQVVETRGSTPQKAGARMLVDPDGGQIGTLGGGCVEAEVKQKALRLLGREGAEIQNYLLDHDAAWADGLVCGGKLAVLVEALKGAGAAEYFRAMLAADDSGRGFTEAIVVDPAAGRVGDRAILDVSGEPLTSFPADASSVRTASGLLGNRPTPAVRGGVAYLPWSPRVRLVIVGAGHVGQAVAELAARAEFGVWVVDDRRQFASPERFPSAEKILVGPMDETLRTLDLSFRDFALIVTRGHGHDQDALACLAPTSAAYVGMIGSRRKVRMIVENLRELGVSEAALRRVSAPVGLDIGSVSVFEIAVSIVAELIARRNLGPGASEAILPLAAAVR